MQSQSIIFAQTLQLFLLVSVPVDAQNTTVGGSGELETRVGWHDGPTGRGTLALLYSCLITIFTCTWTVLHLNVPGLDDGLWTRAIRKTKWMAITILMPEFIFSKAICELRLALSDLHEFEKTIRDDYKNNIKEQDLKCKAQNFNWRSEITWSWEVDYGNTRFLYRLLGLPRPDKPAKPAVQESATELTGVIVASDTAPIESNPSDQRDSDGSKPRSEMPKESHRPGTRRSQSAEHEEAVSEGVDFVHEGETVASKQALRIADAGGSEVISAEGSGQKEEKPLEKNVLSDGAEDGKSREKFFPEKDRKDGENIRKEVTADDGAHGDGEDNVQAESMSFTGGRESLRIRSRRSEKNMGSEKHNRARIPRYTHHVSRKWTLSHSYLANMGGLLYAELPRRQDEGPKYYALTGAKLSRRFLWWRGAHPLKGLLLNDDEIADRSKADSLLRILSVLQISWLVLTVVARGVTALPLTQLEIATLAFSLFAIVTFSANWWKPKDISRPTQLQNMGFGSCQKEFVQKYDKELHAFDWTQSFSHRLLFPHKTNEGSRGIKEITRVSNDMIEMEGNVPLIFRLMAISALIFGAFHCLAWNFAFPSRAELILWKTSSIASAIVPVISLIASLYLNHLATAYADRLLLSFLVDKLLNPLADCCPEYLKLLREPVFADWSYDELKVLYFRPAGHRNFAEKPNEQEQESSKKKERRDAPMLIRRDMKIFLSRMSEFLKAWEEVKMGKRDTTLLQKIDSCYRWMAYACSTGIREFWDDYEQCYVRKNVQASSNDPHQIKYVKLIMDAWGPFQKEQDKLQEFREKCEQVSTASTICGGILYTIARVIIPVLLFTSLRDVRSGVYEQTPWTRFLPSFS
ncbi:hypothetical protein SUNI508_11229 [Seiridium unicorne]|uniref:Uncharacterized protein n=1 Tax=Seiridium unicorne TaxID=138068 RepID=A0ABR2UIQ7_9PEZI